MIELSVRRHDKFLVPAFDSAAFERIKRDRVYRVTLREQRNPKFHRKMFALFNVAFDLWSEHCTPVQYQGEPVAPNFDRFRKDLTILAGFYEPVFTIDGELRLEPKSLRFDSMDDFEFSQLYEVMIDTVIRKVPGWVGRNRQDLIRAADAMVCEFA